ncbi:SDR family oxidoreductase [Enteractinococcus coprophilus]|uniref:NADP-dependent 3-hydroxy acid dehydrogenase YdfG n=1 Tax=Enteractinococcus coprophilus TaxID=1027633 RepID=A0A543AIW4_9MICC|nr:SDR family oxidoreductase [Enteractinococcus coprophilus]TQL72514.1 NADP-dependent 3-hydroxy acid dehydrogenase YdfG [Enteractinococcus coprophilus]
MTAEQPAALVTGATSGIGRATAIKLVRDGWQVFAAGRRTENLETLAQDCHQLSGTLIPVATDVTDDASVQALYDTIEAQGGIDTVLNIAGGAMGAEAVADASLSDWEWMYDTNVLGSLRVIKQFLPMLRAHGAGTVLNLTSTAGIVAYEGGAGYNAAKFGQHALTGALRLEEAEHNIRVIEVLPGLVKTDEFALNRMRGDADKAADVYAGVDKPLTAEDVADVCAYAVNLPHHINLDEIVMRPVKQAAQHKIIRDAQSSD